MAATAKKPILALCPFCPDGGKPGYIKSATSHSCHCLGCGASIMRPIEDDVVSIWNKRSFASGPAAAAAYNALVHVGAMRQLWLEKARKTISKKQIEAAKEAFISAAVGLLDVHGGTIRSSLNELETSPQKHASKPKKRKAAGHA